MAAKIFAIGDIHGCYDKLTTLLERLPFDESADTLIFLGDYINRGPDSSKVLDCLIELKETCHSTFFLKGNHEQMLIDYATSHDSNTLHFLRMMGISHTVESYASSIARLKDFALFPTAHKVFLQSLEFGVILDNFIFTHADINESLVNLLLQKTTPGELDSVTEATLLSSRRLALEKTAIPNHVVVFGHIPFSSPFVMNDRIGIDTGAVYGNMLTALELPGRTFHHA